MSESDLFDGCDDNRVAFSEIEHTADRALRVQGRDWRELFRHAACGMYSLIGAEVNAAAKVMTKPLTIEAQDGEELLVEWLTELAFWVEDEQFVARRFDFREISATRLRAAVSGCRAHRVEKQIKAVTYHDLAIRRTAKGLEVTVVFDV